MTGSDGASTGGRKLEANTSHGGDLEVTYIIGTYPSLTTTFIDREVEALLRRGADLRIVSIRRPHSGLSPAQRDLQVRVSYLLPPNKGELLIAHLRWLLRRPATMLTTLAYLLTRRQRNGSRLRTLLHFSTGVYAAHRVRDRARAHIHAHFVDRAATVAYVAARLLGTTYSVTAHANDIYLRPVMLREKIGNATFAATCTEYNRRHLVTVVGDGIGRKVTRIYHGLDLRAYQPNGNRPAGVPMIVSVGQLKEKKGLRYLLEACGVLAERGLDLRCDIIGDGPLRAELDDLIVRLGLSGRVSLLGPLPHPDVIDRYRTSHLFVLPCIVAADGDRDGIPNAILEAMAMALPVISTPISGIPEVVRDGETGFLVPPGDVGALADTVQRVLKDPELRARVAAAGRRLVTEEFDIGRNVDRLVTAFETRG